MGVGSDPLAEAIFETADALIAVMDRQGRFLKVNAKALEVAGRDEKDLLGKRFWDVVLKPEDAHYFRHRFAEASPALDRTKENVWLSTSGQEHVIAWTNSTVDFPGTDEPAILSIGLDVTEARKTEKRLAHSERLNALGQLTGGIAHDFNNLLAVILGNAEEIASRGTPVEDRFFLADEITRAVKRGASLTKRLLVFGRRADLEPELSNLTQEIAQFTNMAKRILPATVELSANVPDGDLGVNVDRASLDAALLNLVVNCRDAIGQREGSIRITMSKVVFSNGKPLTYGEDLAPGKYASIQVTDTGQGMTKEVMDQVIDPFFTTKPVGQGSGLGLSMVHGFTRQSGGGTIIESKRGKGTTVELFLPLADLPKSQTPPEPRPNEPTKEP